MPRVALAAGVALCCLLVPAPAVVQAALAAAVLVGVAWCVRAVPVELVGALLRRDPAGT